VRGLGVVALVFAGVMMIGQAIALVTVPITYASMAFDMGELATAVYLVAMLPALASLALGLVLILARHSLAERLFDHSDISVSIGPADALRIGFTLLGVWLVLGAIPEAFLALAQGVFQTSATLGVLDVYSVLGADLFGAYANFVMPAVRIALGIFLVAKAEPIAERLWSGPAPAPVKTPRSACSACGETYDPADYVEGAEIRCERCGMLLREGGDLTSASSRTPRS
jgi:hypothetical protein